MTAPNAPGGLKLTEEQVGRLESRMRASLRLQEREVDALVADWRTLRAERDAKDAEITRLRKALIEAGIAAGALLAEEVSTDFLMYVPEEVRLVVTRLRDSAARAEDELRRLRNGEDNA